MPLQLVYQGLGSATSRAGMYLLEPFSQAACAGNDHGLHSLASLAPDHFLT